MVEWLDGWKVVQKGTVKVGLWDSEKVNWMVEMLEANLVV